MQLAIDNNIVSLRTNYIHRDKCAAIPGGRWSPARRMWEYLLTPATASRILQTFRYDMNEDDRKKLDNIASRLVMAQTIKSEMIDLLKPTSATEPWHHQLISYNMAVQLFGLRHPLGMQLPDFGGGAMLALDMGCGKSKCAVDIICNHKDQLKKVLIVCPHSVINVWAGTETRKGQFDIHATPEQRQGIVLVGLGHQGHSLEKKTKKAKLAAEVAETQKKQLVVVINYESAWRDPFAAWAKAQNFDLVVGDELHRIKAAGGKASKFFASLSHHSRCHLGLTGTPLPHSPLDVYGQYRFLDPGIFGVSYSKFRSDYANMGGFQGHQVINYKNLDMLQQKMYLIAHRVMADDVFDLPEFLSSFREFDLSPEEQRLYSDMDSEFMTEVQGNIVTADNALVKLLRLQQITSGVLDGMHVGDSKRNVLADTLEDIPKDEPVVVFARFTPDLEAVRQICEEQGRSYSELSGTSHELEIWQNGKTDVLGVQIQSGKEGVDFTRARYNIYYSLGFSLGDYNQSKKRSKRPGQRRNGFYVHLIARNSVDVKVMKALEQREKDVNQVLYLDDQIVKDVLNQYKEEAKKA